MGPEHTMWLPWGGMWIFPIIFIAIIIFLIFMFSGRCGFRTLGSGPGTHHGDGDKSESASDILNKRYASGEITKDEFEQMKNDISST